MKNPFVPPKGLHIAARGPWPFITLRSYTIGAHHFVWIARAARKGFTGTILAQERGPFWRRPEYNRSVAALFARAARLGRLHAVVNNAGIYGPIGPTEDVALADWNQAWAVNVTGTLLVCQHAVRMMKPAGGGRIINISGGGATTPMPRLVAYAATKAAVVRLTETLAEEYRADGILVNAVAPGALRTRFMQQVLDAGPEKAGAAFYARNKKWTEDGATDPRLGAALCVYLASAESEGITGKLISAQWDPWRDLQRFREDLQGDIYTLRRIVPEDRGRKFET